MITEFVRNAIPRDPATHPVIGTFPGGHSALMPVCARLRHVAGTQTPVLL